jgi:uridine kinase
VALDLIVKHVKRKLKELGMNFREQLLNAHQGERMPDTLYVLPSTNQIKVRPKTRKARGKPRTANLFSSQPMFWSCVSAPAAWTCHGGVSFSAQGLHTIIRNKECPRGEFIFYSSRLIGLAMEYAIRCVSRQGRSPVAERFEMPSLDLTMRIDVLVRRRRCLSIATNGAIGY